MLLIGKTDIDDNSIHLKKLGEKRTWKDKEDKLKGLVNIKTENDEIAFSTQI